MIPSLIQCNSYIIIYQLCFNYQSSKKGRNFHDFLFNIVQQLHHYLSVSIINVQKEEIFTDFLFNTVQQLHHFLSVSIIKV